MIDTDVIIVGAGPTGLMLAGELRLAGARPLVLERQPQPRDTPKANGLGGQILQLLRYRGLLERFSAASTGPSPAPRWPILLDLADRPDLRETARDWQHRIDIHTAETDLRPADALLIRPDAHIAWAATIDAPADTAALALREALSCWSGTPLKTRVPIIDRPS